MQAREELRGFGRRLLLVVASVTCGVLLWIGREIACVVFAGLLLAVLLCAVARQIRRAIPVGRAAALALAVALGAGLLAGFVAATAAWSVEQNDALEESWRNVRASLAPLVERLRPYLDTMGEDAGTLSASVVRAVSYSLTFGFVGLFVASQPRLYEAGVLALVSCKYRPTLQRLLQRVYSALSRWLLARAVSMGLVFVVSVPLFMAVELPLSVLLAGFAGLLTFVPYFGPIVATVPIALVALGVGQHVLWVTMAGYVGVQLFTGFVVDPLLQQRIVHLPAALILVSQVWMAALVGPVGVAVAAPMTLVALVAFAEARKRGESGEPAPERVSSQQEGLSASAASPERQGPGRRAPDVR